MSTPLSVWWGDASPASPLRPRLLRLLSVWSITNECRNKEARLIHDRGKTKNITAFFCFKVCSADLLSQPLQLGGAGHIVVLDESVVAKRKACSNGQACST